MRGTTARHTLAWRVFLTNACVLLGVFAFYLVTPATISEPVAISELIVIVVALIVSLFLNLILLNRVFGPLDEFRETMQSIDPLRPGRRIAVNPTVTEVAELADAFNQMLERLETERRESARRTLTAQEDERRRLARELHDELGQVLTGVLLLLDQAARSGPDEAIEEAREAARESIDKVRRIVRDLRPEALEDLGLVSALASLANGFERHTGIRLERRLPPSLPALSREQELVAYRVAQEALTNVARHAGAERAELAVDHPRGHVRVVVRDDGRGFTVAPTSGRGIDGMRERALLVRGTVTVHSLEGRGTEVALSLPVGAG